MYSLKQLELLDIIYDYFKTETHSPTFQELAERRGIISKASIIQTLRQLRDMGYVEWDSKPRSLRLIASRKMLKEPLRLYSIVKAFKDSIDQHKTIHISLHNKEITGHVQHMEWSIQMFTINGQWEYIGEVERVEVI